MVTTVSTTPTTRPAPRATGDLRPRNRRGHGSLLRDEILVAAAHLLDETGDEQEVTLRAVARHVGISAPSIYQHFADRQAILLALAEDAFVSLSGRLRQAATDAGADPVGRLLAACHAYLDFAATSPQRYRVMFGGLWNVQQAVRDRSVAAVDAEQLGQDALGVLTAGLTECVLAGRSSSTDPHTDAVALWLGLHGLAHQRSVVSAFPWPADIAEHLIRPLARL